MPLVKEIKEEKLESIAELYDRRNFYSGTSEIRFFPPNPSGTINDNNYNSNPLPGQTPYDLLSLGFEIGPSTIRTDAGQNVHPIRIWNTFLSGIVTIRVDGGKERAFEHPLADYLNADAVHYDPSGEILSVGSKALYKLMDPFLVRRNRQFDLTITWEDTQQLPTQAEWQGSSAQHANDLVITSTLQVNDYGENF